MEYQILIPVITILAGIVIVAAQTYTYYRLKKLSIEKQNEVARAISGKKEAEKDIQDLKQIQSSISQGILTNQVELDKIQSNLMSTKENLSYLTATFDAKRAELLRKEKEELAQKDLRAQQKEEDLNRLYQQKLEQLELDFKAKQSELQAEITNLSSLRASLIEAQKREEELQQKQDFYRIVLSIDKQEDIDKLLRFSKECHNPQPLRKLIWSEFYLKPFGDLADRILGREKVCGIYKITSLLNKKVYIGQSVDVKTRWSNHIKASLGIDSIAHSKVHDAMAQDGVWNFTFELLEKCDKSMLNEREKYYIGFYQSNLYGYNLTKGGS